jgi:catechol 2,3-dioxygenase-like lactoylglutathione lyase family enzyme
MGASEIRTKRMSPLHHLDLNVSDLERSRAFYERVLTRIGYRRVDYSTPGEPAGFDWLAPADQGRFSIGLYPARHDANHDGYAPGVHHIALAAPSREAVDNLHGLLLQMSATILDSPREYPKYEPGYYAVFFLDPDGIKLEYVFTPD